MAAEKPLMLKDYLELDSHCEHSFRCPTMRDLLDTELMNHDNHLSKPSSKRSVSKLTNLIQALGLLPSFSCSTSISKRLRRSIAAGRKINKRDHGEKNNNTHDMAHKKEYFKVKDIMRLTSFNNGHGGVIISSSCSPECPSPIVSTCSSSSSTSSTSSRSSISHSSSFSGSDFLISSVDSFTDVNSKNASPPGSVGAGATNNNKDLERKEKMEEQECCLHSVEDESEKEQLSPVSVMDFPYDQDEEEEDDDESSASHGFQQSLANIERTKHQLLQKIRRFECLAELEPLDLNPLFEDDQDSSDNTRFDANADDEVIKIALELVKQLKNTSFTTINDTVEKILLDFFIEGILSMKNEQILLKAGIRWLNQVDYSVQEEDDDLSVVYLKEMEENGQWRCFKDDETEVAVDLELDVMESLLDELVLDLLA